MLIVDNRERLCKITFANIFETGIIEQKTLTYGDYAIYNGDKLVCVFERKTLDDYVASIKDGRLENIKIMIGKANELQAKAYIILEGPMYNDDHEIGGIKYSTIIKSVDTFTCFHGLYQMRTSSLDDTLNRLVYIHSKLVTVANSAAAGAELTIRKKKSEREILVELLVGNLKGVGKITADKILDAGSICHHIANWSELSGKLNLNATQLEQYNAFFGGVNVSVLSSNDLRHLFGCSKNTEPGTSIRDVCLNKADYSKFAKFKVLGI
jgi:ERCC4-type nuclease